MSERPAPYGSPRRGGHITHGGLIDQELVKAAGIVPATRDADGNVKTHPERLEITPVDPRIFDWLANGDEFVDRICVKCGLGSALFVCAGRFVSLCPSCVGRRIEVLRARTGADGPAWVTLLDKEASKEAAYQAWKMEGLYSLVFDDLWKCGRCGALIQPREAHYYRRPGEVEGPPYCAPCAEALGKEGTTP